MIIHVIAVGDRVLHGISRQNLPTFVILLETPILYHVDSWLLLLLAVSGHTVLLLSDWLSPELSVAFVPAAFGVLLFYRLLLLGYSFIVSLMVPALLLAAFRFVQGARNTVRPFVRPMYFLLNVIVSLLALKFGFLVAVLPAIPSVLIFMACVQDMQLAVPGTLPSVVALARQVAQSYRAAPDLAHFGAALRNILMARVRGPGAGRAQPGAPAQPSKPRGPLIKFTCFVCQTDCEEGLQIMISGWYCACVDAHSLGSLPFLYPFQRRGRISVVQRR
jgi:hypothetical protein